MPAIRNPLAALLAFTPLLAGCDLMGSRVAAAVPPVQFSLDAPPTFDSNIRNNVRVDRTKYENKLLTELLDLAPSGSVPVAELENLSRRSDLVHFDRNADGRVTDREVRKSIEEIFAEERKQSSASSRNKRKQPACSLPRPSDFASILVLTAEAGNAYTNVTVSGQSEVTTVVHLTVEEGQEPIYIFAVSTEPVIWKVDGETARIERFVAQRASSEFAGTGIHGLPRNKIEFRSLDSCAVNSIPEMDAPDFYLGPILKRTLRRDDMTGIHTSGYSQIRIPSGRLPPKAKTMIATGPRISSNGKQYVIDNDVVKKVDTRVARRLEDMLLRFKPGGIVHLDRAEVVTPSSASYYNILPAQAGLLQLLQDGTLSTDSRGHLVIEKTFPQFPAQLYGAHSEEFLLRQGVAMPGGNPGHSSIYDEKTGVCLKGTCSLN